MASVYALKALHDLEYQIRVDYCKRIDKLVANAIQERDRLLALGDSEEQLFVLNEQYKTERATIFDAYRTAMIEVQTLIDTRARLDAAATPFKPP
jgi:hypothetical protein